jgi:Trk K+ transport system NAD-binding subunit
MMHDYLHLVPGKKGPKKNSEMDLPEKKKVIFYYRDDKFYFVDEKTSFNEGDEIVILAHRKNLSSLNERWNSEHADEKD